MSSGMLRRDISCRFIIIIIITAGFMTHVTCWLTAKNRDQFRNATLGNRVWATFTFCLYCAHCDYCDYCILMRLVTCKWLLVLLLLNEYTDWLTVFNVYISNCSVRHERSSSLSRERAVAVWHRPHRTSRSHLATHQPPRCRAHRHRYRTWATTLCRYKWHSSGSLGWPLLMLKCGYIFHT